MQCRMLRSFTLSSRRCMRLKLEANAFYGRIQWTTPIVRQWNQQKVNAFKYRQMKIWLYQWPIINTIALFFSIRFSVWCFRFCHYSFHLIFVLVELRMINSLGRLFLGDSHFLFRSTALCRYQSVDFDRRARLHSHKSNRWHGSVMVAEGFY